MKREEFFFRTMVELPKWEVPMQVTDASVFLGSCFAQNMGNRFLDYELPCLCNPLGVLYNPESISLQIHQALHAGEVEPPVFSVGGEWRCWWAGTLLGGKTEGECCEVIEGALAMLGMSLRNARFLFVTLGTNVCYRLSENGQSVVNCHKMPSRLFYEDSLSLQQCTALLSNIVDEIIAVNPQCRIVFTVSPYRYAKYGLHGNQLAKATLQLACESVKNNYPDIINYFPAYEILMDELRDYRFYSTDMLHPSQESVDYIWSCLCQSVMSDSMQQYIKEFEEIQKGLSHRPRNPESQEYRKFLLCLQEKKLHIKEKYLLQ